VNVQRRLVQRRAHYTYPPQWDQGSLYGEQIKKAERSKLCLVLQKKCFITAATPGEHLLRRSESPGINARLTIFAAAAKENLHYKENYFHNSH
jgi:hypothetical protein